MKSSSCTGHERTASSNTAIVRAETVFVQSVAEVTSATPWPQSSICARSQEIRFSTGSALGTS